MESTEFARIGRIVGAFGLKGELKIEPLTDFLDRFEKGSRLRLKGDWVTVESYRLHKDRPLIKLSSIRDVEAAKSLQWEYLEAEASESPEMEADEYMVDDLIGLAIVTEDGKEIGNVEDVLNYPAQDLLKSGELLIPLVKEFIKSVDIKAGVIRVELIPGMLPE